MVAKLRAWIGASMLLALGLLGGCEPAAVRQSREVMGTLAGIEAQASSKAVARAAVEAAYDRVGEVTRLMNAHVDTSEIGRLNKLPAGLAMTVSPETLEVLRRAAAVSESSGGAFDVTCRPLITLWKEAAQRGDLPGDDDITTTLERVGWRKLRIDPDQGTVTPTVEGMKVDLGGIAKGYALDLAVEAMRQAGASAGLVDIGGDVRVFGRREDGGMWHIGIRHPFDSDRLYGTLALTDQAVATSGIQQRFFEIEGKRYSHIIDPRTGRPAEQSPSVTVIAPDGATADAWATVFSVLTVEEGRKLAETIDSIEVLWLYGQGPQPQAESTDGFAQLLMSAPQRP